jgi:eukaryotic-like serine/threonine-protein kinase
MTDELPSSPVSLEHLTQIEYARFSQLLGELLDAAPDDRAVRLEALERSDAKLLPLLREMLALQAQVRNREFLEDLGPLPAVLPLGELDQGLVGRLFGPYRVLSLLGRGGMGNVWLAERVDGLFTRSVALKLIHPVLLGRVTAERFARERNILAGLNHPNIARLLDAGSSVDGQPYLALDYIDGTPLTSYCDERRLSIVARLRLFRRVLSAVEYAHAHLVIHRDLKPSNILVSADGSPHLLDFGIAKLLTEGEAKETELTQMGGRAMTPDYSAPEQILGAPVTTAADVYALGVILYELMTGQRPYKLERDTRGALEDAILRTDPVLPSRVGLGQAACEARGAGPKKLARELVGEIDTIVLKSLKKSPLERYPTAEAFGADIERHLRGDVVLAQPDTFAYAALKFARRHRLAIGASGALVLTLAAGLAATAYEAQLASRQRDEARAAEVRLQTAAAAAHLGAEDVPGAERIILEVLSDRGMTQANMPQALSVFQEARAADGQIMALTGHEDRVRSVAYSSDGARLVTTSYDKSARIWDAATGLEISRLVGHDDRVRSAAFSADGTRVVTGSFDKTARIWDAATGRELVRLEGQMDRVQFVAFSPDGRQVATASDDKTVRVWDASSGRQLRLLQGHTEVVSTVTFSADGRRLVTASDDRTARVWEASTGRQLLVLQGHEGAVESAQFSSDGSRIVTASLDKSARVWDASSGRELLELIGHGQLLTSAAFSPDGLRIVTTSADFTARLWNAATGRPLRVLGGHGQMVNWAAFSPDGRRVATASDDATVRIWDATGSGDLRTLSGHSDMVETAAFSPDGTRAVTASDDKTARIWDCATGKELTRLIGHTLRVNSAAFSRDGRRVVTASTDRTARIWDAATGAPQVELAGHTDLVLTAEFSPDGKRVLTASEDASARIWDAASGRELTRLLGHTLQVEGAAFSADGARVVTVSDDKTARIWDATTGRQLLVLRGHTDTVERAAFSADGRFVATASDDKTARLWEVATGKEVMRLLGHNDAVASAVFSPDGRRVLTASSDRTARLWDAATGRELRVLSGHADALMTAVFSPDGGRILTASLDRTARLWESRVAPLDAQIEWSKAAQFDALSETQRFQLGLGLPRDARRWQGGSPCDEAAAAPYDPSRQAAGVMLEQLDPAIALAACSNASGADRDARRLYQEGRARLASGDFAGAADELEHALRRGYAAAGLDLGMLLTTPAGGRVDVQRALALYQRAWQAGVTMAAYKLGALYETGFDRIAPDSSLAWAWYAKAAGAGDPPALARYAQQAEREASGAASVAARDEHLLQAFRVYAAAAERARRAGWPDDSWRSWRYRRASLARLLERDGMMEPVADAYRDIDAKAAR